MKNAEIKFILSTFFDEIFDVEENGSDVKLFFLFFLSFEGSFSLINIFFSYNSFFFSLMTVPSTDVFDCFDCCEFAVVDVNIVSDSYEWLVNISDWIFHLACCFVCLCNSVVEAFDFWIVENNSYYLKSD